MGRQQLSSFQRQSRSGVKHAQLAVVGRRPYIHPPEGARRPQAHDDESSSAMGWNHQLTFDPAHRDWHGNIGLVAEKVSSRRIGEEKFTQCWGNSNENE